MRYMRRSHTALRAGVAGKTADLQIASPSLHTHRPISILQAPKPTQSTSPRPAGGGGGGAGFSQIAPEVLGISL